MPSDAKVRKDARGILYKRFMSPKNPQGENRRLFVKCPPEYNTHVKLKELEKNMIDRWMSGAFTISDSFESYVRERFMVEYPAAKNLKKSARDSLTYLFEKIALPELGKKRLAAIDAAEVARFTAKLQGRTKELKKSKETIRSYSDQTIRLAVVAIISVLRWAVKVGDLAKMPNVSAPKVASARKPKPYTAEESQQLMAAARDDEELAVFRLMYDAGMRKSEILGLTWGQIDRTMQVLTIDRQRYRGVDAITKSGRERRFVMTPEIDDALKAIKHLRSQYVFCDGDGIPHPEHWLRWVFARAVKKAGLRQTRIHDARHHLATRATKGGMATLDLRELLGHADVRTTQDYVHSAAPLPPSLASVAK